MHQRVTSIAAFRENVPTGAQAGAGIFITYTMWGLDIKMTVVSEKSKDTHGTLLCIRLCLSFLCFGSGPQAAS